MEGGNIALIAFLSFLNRRIFFSDHRFSLRFLQSLNIVDFFLNLIKLLFRNFYDMGSNFLIGSVFRLTLTEYGLRERSACVWVDKRILFDWFLAHLGVIIGGFSDLFLWGRFVFRPVSTFFSFCWFKFFAVVWAVLGVLGSIAALFLRFSVLGLLFFFWLKLWSVVCWCSRISKIIIGLWCRRFWLCFIRQRR